MTHSQDCIQSFDLVIDECKKMKSFDDFANTFETFLAGCVPNLQFDILVVNFHSSASELNSDCQVMLLPETLVSKLEEQT